jgi:hypothetical protein
VARCSVYKIRRLRTFEAEARTELDMKRLLIALAAGAVALALTPFLRPGVPVLLSSVVAVVAGIQAVRDRSGA